MQTFLVVFLLLSLTACKKFLDQKSSSTLVSPSTLKDLQGLLDDASLMNSNLTPCLGEVSADDYFLLQSTWSSQSTINQNAYIWQKQAYLFPNDWSQSYGPVYNANFCLDFLKEKGEKLADGVQKNNVEGSALFFRSYNFLNLLWNFSKAYNNTSAQHDLGIVLRLGSDFNEKSVRSNVEACYKKVIEDTKAAIPLLPELPTHVYRPSKCAAYALLARTFLSMREYDSAYRYANLSLSLKNDILNYSEINLIPNNPFPVFNKEIIFYTEMYPFIANLALGLVDTVLYNSYSNDDLRKKAFFRVSGSYFAFKGSYAASGYFTGLAVDEILLIKAECEVRKGNRQEALKDINLLLKNRYNSNFTNYTATTDEEALILILNERRKELMRRGLRWIDIKRLNEEGRNINITRLINNSVYELKAKDNYFALPIPDDVIRISEIEQNP